MSNALVETALLIVMIIACAIAAYTDIRFTKIHNLLTLPVAALGVVTHLLVSGPMQAGISLASGLVCAFVPAIMFFMTGRGGGDVKLFFAAGCVLLYNVGLEFQLVAFVFAALIALGTLAWQGKLLSTLGNVVFLIFNPLLPKKSRRSVAPETLNPIKLGVPMLIAAILIALIYMPRDWSV